MSREAMQMALEALEDANDVARMEFSDENYYSEAINALRQALEEKQEPVMWLKNWSDGSVSVLKTKSHAFADHELEPLYAAPQKREWVGLTDEEIYDCEEEVGMPQYEISSADLYEFARAIEAKLREKSA